VCGIVAVVNFQGLTESDMEAFKHVLVESEKRGSDSTGVGLQDLTVVKAPIKSSVFVETKMFQNITRKALKQKWIVGHTRHSTQGNPKENINNHPLKIFNDRALVVHNGIVHSEVIKSDKNRTDSYIVAHAVEKSWGPKSLQSIVKEAYTMFYGYAATIVFSRKSIVFTAVNNPLSLGYLPNGSIVFASVPSFFPVGTTSVLNFSSGDCLSLNTKGDASKITVKTAETPKQVYNWDTVYGDAFPDESDDFDLDEDDLVQSTLFRKDVVVKSVKVKKHWKNYSRWD